MNSARKPLRLNSDPSGYDKEGYKYKGGYSRRSSSPGEREGAEQGHSNSRGYSRYNNHRHQQSSDNRDYKYGRAKDLRDSDRERWVWLLICRALPLLDVMMSDLSIYL